MNLTKDELQKIWNQLDGACEGLEKLMQEGVDTSDVDFSAIVILKNKVEEMSLNVK